MEKSIQKLTMAFLVLMFTAIALPSKVYAQDATVKDPKHYKVEFENDEVRILRITYGPGETSVMHSHPKGVAFFVTDYEATFELSDGQVIEVSGKAGSTMWNDAAQHLPTNTGKKPMEVIQVEFKSKKNNY